MSTEKIQQIIQKIREIAKYNPNIKGLVQSQNATIRMKETENGEIKLYCIDFAYYHILSVYENHMLLSLDGGTQQILFEYDGWDGLLAM